MKNFDIIVWLKILIKEILFKPQIISKQNTKKECVMTTVGRTVTEDFVSKERHVSKYFVRNVNENFKYSTTLVWHCSFCPLSFLNYEK